MIPNAAIGGGAGPVPGHPGDLSPGLYVHIPFCDSRCTYCDFHTSIYRSQVAHRYLEALRREADQVAAEAPPPRTIFVGG
ncbi:MAG: radical SAM protein, partial [Planctomycetota bacterium]